MSDAWRPTADRDALQARADLLASVREFFRQRGVLEVETPLMGQFAVTDPQLDPMSCEGRYLQTSPEYAMKRLLAAGSGPIFQVCKAFRSGESGSRHNPEFTLLEWYRPGFDPQQLMAEIAELVMSVTGLSSWAVCRYEELFQQYLGVDPHRASDAELRDCAAGVLETSFSEEPRDTWLDLLMSHVIEPQLAGRGLLFVHDYPESQAGLARLRVEGDALVAERFELFLEGMELANGYCELTDATEQSRRFETDVQALVNSGQEPRAIDTRLISALESGLPACSGVALGLDRLLMNIMGKSAIGEVLGFSWDRA